jgi:hypothetical protein
MRGIRFGKPEQYNDCKRDTNDIPTNAEWLDHFNGDVNREVDQVPDN